MKTVFLTGSTDGIGKHLAEKLLKENYRVILHGRNQERLKKVEKEFLKQFNQDFVYTAVADLSDFSQVKEMCNQIIKNQIPVDVIVHNAGTFEKTLVWNPDQIEKTFAVNFVSNVLINELMIPYWENHFQKQSKEPLRVIFVSSIAHSSGRFSLNEWFSPTKYSGYQAYANSKMALVMYTYFLAEKYKNSPMIFHSLHPGVIDTKILRDNFHIRGASLDEGIKTLYFLITSDEAKKNSGKYWNNLKIEKSHNETYNIEYQRKLYEETIKRIQKYL